MLKKLAGLGVTVAGFLGGAVGVRKVGPVAVAGLLLVDLMYRGKLSGVSRQVVTGAGVAAGLAATGMVVDMIDRSDVLGKYERSVLGPINQARLAAGGW